MAYIGRFSNNLAVRVTYFYTAAGGETSLSGADDNGNTLSFTDGNYVDVYLNGVLLVKDTDYNVNTANTISSLAALTASDIVEIVVYDIFAIADTVSKSNGGTFDGAVIVDGAFTASGLVTAQDGLVVDNDGATVATFDRATSDGTIVEFQKDGTTSGTTGHFGGAHFYTGPASGILFNGTAIEPTTGTGSTRTDGTNDLGQSGYRFKDLYLSGGVYLGGTAAANYLDDYEEGTWTPTFTSTGGGSATMGANTEGLYVKTGNVVYVSASLEMGTNSLSSGGLQVSGLPFTPSGNSPYRNSTAFFSYTVNVIPQPYGGTFDVGQSYIQVWNQGNNSTYQATDFDNSGRAVVSGFYFTT